MFDVENAISQWTAGLAESGSITRENVAELEGHLRESIAELTSHGLSARESFAVATMRLGGPGTLAAEFVKVNGDPARRKRVLWMLWGYAGGLAAAQAVDGLGALAGVGASLAGFAGAPAAMTAMLVAAACWSGLAAGLWRASQGRHGRSADRLSPVWLAGAVAMIVGGGGLALGGEVLEARLATFGQFQDSAWWNAVGEFAMSGFVLAACLTMIVLLGRRERIDERARVC